MKTVKTDQVRLGNLANVLFTPETVILLTFSWVWNSFQTISEFLKDLPSYNAKNFALFNTENGLRTSSKRPPVYLPTVEVPAEQSE